MSTSLEGVRKPTGRCPVASAMACSAVVISVIGLVGGIASGKSTVAALFAVLRPGVRVDADAIARKVVARPSVQEAIVTRLPAVTGRDGSVDRQKLARLAFSNRAALKILEEITHQEIRRAVLTAIRKTAGIVYLDAPLLLETGADELCDWLVYVACPARVRRRRARTRGWTDAEHRRRERRQWPLRKKRARADFVVDNHGNLAATRRDVRRVLRRLEKSGA